MPTDVDFQTVLEALITHLTGDSTFNTGIGGTASKAGLLNWEQVERGESMPYAVLTLIDNVADDDSFDKSGYRYRVQISLYGSETVNVADLVDLADKLRARMHRVKWTVTNHDQPHARLDIERGPTREGDARRIDHDYLIFGLRT